MDEERVNVPDEGALLNTSRVNSVLGHGHAPETATAAELAVFMASNDRPFWVFGESRELPIRRVDSVRRAWLKSPQGRLESVRGAVQPGEYFVFQLGLWTGEQELRSVSVAFGDLIGAGDSIPATSMSCFNLGGIDYLGKPFAKRLDVPTRTLQALWCGIEVPADAGGSYTGTVMVSAENAATIEVTLSLAVGGSLVADRGDHEAGRLARLRWLDSRIGLDDDHVVKPYRSLERDGHVISLLGRKLEIGSNGMPAQVESFFSASNTHLVAKPLTLLAQPMRLVVELDGAPLSLAFSEPAFTHETASAIHWRSVASSESLTVEIDGSLEFDGALDYRISVTPLRAVPVTDIRLEVCHAEAAAGLFMGLGRGGCVCPGTIDWRWTEERHQDAYWIGAVNGGMQLRFKGSNYRKPACNVYYQHLPLRIPESWGNGGRGGLQLTHLAGGEVSVCVYSGGRDLVPGEALHFDLDMLLTPFKSIDTEAKWRERYFHQGGMDNPWINDPAKVAAAGATVMNVHHCTDPIPVINYPMWERSYGDLKHCVARAHSAGIRLKAYYTIREITSLLPELHAFHSLDGEIIAHGDPHASVYATNPEGAHPWLLDQLGDDFIPAWRATLGGQYEGTLDLAVITTPDSRLDNFWLEGLDFLARDAAIDGIYIDDTSLGRKAMQRARRILETRRPAPLIDMHMWRGTFKPQFGNVEPTTMFLGNFAYCDRIWPGEGYPYHDFDPTAWLLEVSGIPFGVMGEMLQGGGNPWLGMVYGMTTRLGWHTDPTSVWRFWDSFGMAGTEMIGYWDHDCPVKADHPDVLATVFRKPGKTLIALGNFGEQSVKARLSINWASLGYSHPVGMTAEAIPDYQPAARFASDTVVPVEAKRGWLLSLAREEL